MRTLERWKLIEEFPNFEVSNLGSIRHFKNKDVLCPHVHRDGYLRYSFRKDGKMYSRYIHRLVLKAFAGSSKGRECNHIDGDKTNNVITNLGWTTRSGNIKHAYQLGLMNRKGENNGFSKLKNGEVWLIRKLWDSGKATQTFISKMFRISISSVNYIVWRESWKEEVVK